MKKLLLLSFLLLFISGYSVFGQILYDDGPIVVGDGLANFNVQGNKWSSNNITYYFQVGTSDISGTAEEQAVRDAFALWACVSPLTFTEVNSASAADIVIKWATGDHGDGAINAFDGRGETLAHAFYPPPNGGSLAGDIHFDDAETWTTSTRPGFSQPIDLVTVAAHEIGHSLGLAHSSELNALMYPYYSGSHRYLDVDDINGIQSIYGTAGNDGLSKNDNEVCYTGSLTVQYSDPCGANTYVTGWTSSSNVTILSSSSSSVNVRASSGFVSGSGWVKATLSNGLEVTESFWVGRPAAVTDISYNLMMNFPSEICVSSLSASGDFYAGSVPSYADNARWETSAGPLLTSATPTSYSSVSVRLNSHGNNNYIRTRNENECGSSAWKTEYFDLVYNSQGCSGGGGGIGGIGGGGFGEFSTAYPNPSTGMINIQLSEPVELSGDFGFTREEADASYSLYDIAGRLVTSGKMKNKATLDVTDVKKGRYILHVQLKDQVETHQIILE